MNYDCAKEIQNYEDYYKEAIERTGRSKHRR